MAEHIPTPRQICPLLTTGTVKSSTLVDATGNGGEVKLTPVQCLGAGCQVWIHDAGLPPETGDCGLKLSALFAATGATQAGLINENLAKVGELVMLLAKKQGLVTEVNAAPVTA